MCFTRMSCLQTGREYVPGQPGADWSEEEVNVMRAKVLKLIETNEVNEMSLFRLSFHDCVTYKDGSGGCDGTI